MTQTQINPAHTRSAHDLNEMLRLRHADAYANWAREEALVAAMRQNLDAGPGDEVDHAMVRAQLDEQVTLAHALRMQVDEMAVAVERSEAGAYGVCERCHEPIPAERLELFPGATQCVACKSWAEKH